MSLSYPEIGVHAVSTDSSVFPHRACLLLLHSEDSEDVEDEDNEVVQYRFVLQKEEECKNRIHADFTSNCRNQHIDIFGIGNGRRNSTLRLPS